MKKYVSSNYLSPLFLRPASVINKTAALIKKNFPDCDGIIVSAGFSGSSIVIPVALKLKKKFAIVRTKKTHSSNKIEGCQRINKYVIIDDFIETGTTLDKIIFRVDTDYTADLQGIVLYCEHNPRTVFHSKFLDRNIPIVKFDAERYKLK